MVKTRNPSRGAYPSGVSHRRMALTCPKQWVSVPVGLQHRFGDFLDREAVTAAEVYRLVHTTQP